MHHTLRTLTRTAAVLAVGALLAATPLPSAQAVEDDVSEMCFVTSGQDIGLGRLSGRDNPLAYVGGTLTGNTNRYWLKFDLGDLPADAAAIESATLTLTAGRKSILELGVALGEDDWDAATIDWDTQPDFLAPTSTELYTFTAGSRYTWDVTSHVVFDLSGGDRTLSLLLMQVPEGDRSGNVWFHTDLLAPSEDDRPSLCIRYREQTNTPPEVEVGEPIELWPPNRTMHTFTLADLAAAVDAEDGTLDPNVAGRIVAVTSNEETEAKECGSSRWAKRVCRKLPAKLKDALFGPDIAVLDDATFQVRAERDGRGEGRFYTVLFEITDAGGLVTEAEATIVVPKCKKPERRAKRWTRKRRR